MPTKMLAFNMVASCQTATKPIRCGMVVVKRQCSVAARTLADDGNGSHDGAAGLVAQEVQPHSCLSRAMEKWTHPD
jgi:hypothetical protein